MLTGVVERTVLESHDGRTGGVIEKLRLDDGTRLVLKRVRPATDLAGPDPAAPTGSWRS